MKNHGVLLFLAHIYSYIISFLAHIIYRSIISDIFPVMSEFRIECILEFSVRSIFHSSETPNELSVAQNIVSFGPEGVNLKGEDHVKICFSVAPKRQSFSTMLLKPTRGLLLTCFLLLPFLLLDAVKGGGDEGTLTPLDDFRNQDLNATRAGIIDLFQMPQGEQDIALGLCHIAFYNMFSFVLPDIGRVPVPFTDLLVGGFAAAHLAIQMLNMGDGSVVPELDELPQKCPIRFTIEAFDTGVNPNVVADSIQQVITRTTPQEREVCAVMGAEGTRTTIPLAMLTGLQDRPQLTPMASGSQLDDQQMFPLLGRLVSSDLDQMLPLVLYWKQMGVSHVGIIHWNDDHGNAIIRAINEISAQYHPALVIVAADIPSIGATPEDYATALDILEKTHFRWFYASVSAEDCLALMEQASNKKLAGTGEHMWMFYGTILSSIVDTKMNHTLAQAMSGAGFFILKLGRPGMPVFDKFVEAWKKLDNPSDVALLNSRMVQYPDERDFPPPVAESTMFATDPSAFASVVFDSTIMFGLSACAAAASVQEDDVNKIHVDGTSMFKQILGTTFQGATGNVILHPETGTRLPETGIYIVANLLEEDFNETHALLTSTESGVYLDGHWTEETPYVYNDGTTRIPSDLPKIKPEVIYIGRALRILGIALASLILLMSVAFAACTIVKRNDHVVRASQPVFLLLLCLGTCIMGLAIIPLSIDDEIASTHACDVACMTSPWFTSVGFTLTFSALFAKTWRVNRLLSTPSIQRAKVTVYDVMTPLLTILVADTAVLVSWTATHPLRWEREITIKDPFDRALESRGQCTSDGYAPFVTILVVIDAVSLCLAAYQAYAARGVATEFAESDYIARAIMVMILVSSIGIPTMILVEDDARASFFAMTSIISTLCFSVLTCIFVPKIKASFKGDFNVKDAVRRSMMGASTLEISGLDSDSMQVSGVKIVSNANMLQKYRSENEQLTKEITELKRQMAEITSTGQAQEKAPMIVPSSTTTDGSDPLAV